MPEFTVEILVAVDALSAAEAERYGEQLAGIILQKASRARLRCESRRRGCAGGVYVTSYLTLEQIETLTALVARPDLASHFADVVIASAYVTGQTPRGGVPMGAGRVNEHSAIIRAALESAYGDWEAALAAVAVWEEETSRLREQLEALEAGGDRLSAVAVAEATQPCPRCREMHRRAQAAESALAQAPTFAVLTDALDELRRVKSERHTLRNDNEFMRRERGRLQAQIQSLTSAATSDGPQAVATEIETLRAERDEARAERDEALGGLESVRELYAAKIESRKDYDWYVMAYQRTRRILLDAVGDHTGIAAEAEAVVGKLRAAEAALAEARAETARLAAALRRGGDWLTTAAGWLRRYGHDNAASEAEQGVAALREALAGSDTEIVLPDNDRAILAEAALAEARAETARLAAALREIANPQAPTDHTVVGNLLPFEVAREALARLDVAPLNAALTEGEDVRSELGAGHSPATPRQGSPKRSPAPSVSADVAGGDEQKQETTG